MAKIETRVEINTEAIQNLDIAIKKMIVRLFNTPRPPCKFMFCP